MNKTELNHAIQDDIETLRWMNVHTLGSCKYDSMNHRWAMLMFLFLWGSFFGAILIPDLLFKWQKIANDPITSLVTYSLCSALIPFFCTLLFYRTLCDLVWFKQELQQKLKTGSIFWLKMRNVGWRFYSICLVFILLPSYGSGIVFYCIEIFKVITGIMLIKYSFDYELGIFRSTGFIKAVDKYLKRLKHAAKGFVHESI